MHGKALLLLFKKQNTLLQRKNMVPVQVEYDKIWNHRDPANI